MDDDKHIYFLYIDFDIETIYIRWPLDPTNTMQYFKIPVKILVHRFNGSDF